MSKAEEFIKAKTRIGSNTTKGWHRNGVSIPSYSLPWLTPDVARKAVEIAREEVVERVIEWLIDNTHDYYDGEDEFVIFDITKKQDNVINDFKQAMKDETENL